MTALSITIGRGRRNPRGRVVPLPDGVSPARGLATALQAQAQAQEAWWSVHSWRDGHRLGERWLSAMGVQVDLDYHDAAGAHVATPPETASGLDQAAREGKLPGNVFHLTPRGARFVFCFSAPVSDREVWLRATRGAASLVQAALKGLKLVGFLVDEGALKDFARFVYSPRAAVDDVQRAAEVLVIRDEPYDPATLAPPPTKPRPAPALSLNDAAKRYRLDHAREWPKPGSASCPACGHNDCFGRFPDDATRWACFSSNHSGVGIRGLSCWHGDVLDLDAHAASCTAAELLKREGYLAVTAPSAPAPQPTTEPTQPIPIQAAKLKGLTKSYASLCAVLRNDRRIIPQPLEWNEMTCGPTVGGRELEDHDTGRLREQIELNVINDKGKGLQFGADAIEAAVHQVAHEHAYHPVREYLQQLEWDRVPRIASVAEELLGIERTPYHLVLLKRWFVGAVARIFRPGCELQMVLVFCGNEGLGKSRFFKALAGADWFSDERIDIKDKDARMLLQRVWMLEWGELAALKGSSWEDVKAFITSTTNDFRPPYGRKMMRALRHCLFVGTANEVQFLSGREGERRFWPITIPSTWEIPLDLVAQWRDQLWAEAVHLYAAGEQWWLTPEEKQLLRDAHQAHVERHPWEEPVAEWLAGWQGEVTTSAVLEKAIRKPTFQWNRADEMVVGRVLRALGYTRERRRDETGERAYLWRKIVPSVPTSSPPESTEVGT